MLCCLECNGLVDVGRLGISIVEPPLKVTLSLKHARGEHVVGLERVCLLLDID
ncbi:hypothetical protein BC831DRAFT_485298 [Entophlyctis helioformis]|nr:hypothetical protein BC831DRAFT_485298 [Entophlyctis helioformis]